MLPGLRRIGQREDSPTTTGASVDISPRSPLGTHAVAGHSRTTGLPPPSCSPRDSVMSGPAPVDNNFHHLALIYDGSRLNALIDGVGRADLPLCTGNVALPPSDLSIGRFVNGKPMAAIFDELRVSAGIARSQPWIVTGFNNQKSPATFSSLGPSEPHP